MSAFVVNKAHIDYLIAAGLRYAGAREALSWYDPKTFPVWEPTSVAAWDTYRAKCAEANRELTRETVDRVGAMLWSENHRSVSGRYQEGQVTPQYRFESGPHYAAVVGKFEDGWHWRRVALSPAVALKELDCYEYQTRESDDWKGTEAFAFCEALRDALIGALPGYEVAPWGIDAIEAMAGSDFHEVERESPPIAANPPGVG